jgi:hypothetical protein
LIACLATVGALLVSADPLRAQTQALDFTGGFPSSINNTTIGWAFALSGTVSVTDLGLFDQGNDGFIDPHPVGLWRNDGTLLATTTLAFGLSGTVVPSGSGFGAFRYNAITPVVLTPGNYVVGAYFPATANINVPQDRPYFNSIATTAAGFTYTEFRASIQNPALIFPGFTFPMSGGFGPNLRFTSVAAPEPGTLALLALIGLPAAGTVIRRSRVSIGRRSA